MLYYVKLRKIYLLFKNKVLLYNRTVRKSEFSVKIFHFVIELTENIEYLSVVLDKILNRKTCLER